jgi:AraC family transcriptional regulator, positive regulator of tynA and feaB
MSPDVNTVARSSPRVWPVQGASLQIEGSGAAPDQAPFKLMLQVAGACQVRQGGRTAVLAAHQLAFIDGAEPFVLETDGPFEQVLVSLPRGLVTSLYRNIEHRTAVGLADTGAQVLVRDVVLAYAGAARQMDARAHAHATSAIAHLLGAMDPVGMQTPAEHLVVKALALVDAQIDRATAEDVARQLGVSRRYLDKLLAHTGRSFAAHLWDRRIVLAAEWLRRPGQVRVTEVAHGVGFKDSSHFARMFRARYGVAPRHWMMRTEVGAADVDAGGSD